MDVFVEQIVKRELTTGEKVWRGVICGVSIFSATVFLVMSMMMIGLLRIVVMALAVGVIFLAYRLIKNMNIEFEYAITNGSVDIDKIVAKSKRSRLVATSCKEFESFGRYNPAEHEGKNYQNRVVATTFSAEDRWYATFRQSGKGFTILIFNPDQKVLDAIKRHLPVLLRREIDG